MRAAHAVKRTLPEVTRLAPTRPFAWLGRYRRLSKDYEKLTETSEAMIQMAMIHIMVRRLEPTSQYPLVSQKEGVEPSQTT